ncbi:MAG: prepilin-type N-terminal cleavage/methylation domain-containing protein [Candidatus Spechtbacterales bacterium]|nr:prepilin-type N-terminal cleavage/methylation domain-containing protein [Candidatus Spechtbacterales bacterium]
MSKQHGFGLIEIITSVALAAVILVTFLSLLFFTAEISRTTSAKLRASLYLREMVEIAKALEAEDWNELTSASCPCYPYESGGEWILEDDAGLVPQELEGGAYTRSFNVEDVYRDDVDSFPNNIVDASESGAELDPNTKKIVATITWNRGTEPYTRTIETYVYNQ